MSDEQNTPAPDAPKADTPAPAPDAPKAAAPADTPKADAPNPDAPKADAPKDGDAPKDAPKAEAPADYAALKLPEGYKADDPVFADAVKLFEGEKIAPEVAQKLIDFTVERDKAIAKAVNDQSAAQWTKQTGEWRANAEKEFSADQLGNAKTALAQVFDKETVAYLEGLGFTNHPGLIRGMVKVSQAIKDDTFVTGNAGRGNGALDPKSFYPNTQHN